MVKLVVKETKTSSLVANNDSATSETDGNGRCADVITNGWITENDDS